MDDYEPEKENLLLDYQEKLNRYWDEKTKNLPATIKVERQWAQMMRIKFDALVEAGFSKEESADMIKAILGKST